MEEQFIRTAAVLGEETVKLIQSKTVMLLGLGGVGAACAEALVRGGIGRLILVDGDIIKPSNINRQLFALHSTLGMKKTDAAIDRLKDINPNVQLEPYSIFVNENNIHMLPFDECDLIIDAIDDTAAKVFIAKLAQDKNIPAYACMGTGNKAYPSMFKFADIYDTNVCPLCRKMRKLYKNAGIEKLTVLYSPEPVKGQLFKESGKIVPGSTSFTPPIAGMMLAGKALLYFSEELSKEDNAIL
jgi:tRNA A37 threonylcarbamoyladenosine dehydratase